MKLHLPCSLRKAVLAAIAATPIMASTALADNNIIVNHGEVEDGISIGKDKSGKAYGWASGLDFTADGESACFLGVSTDFSDFDTGVFTLPDLPTMPDSLLPPNPAALAQFALQMIDYSVKLAKMIDETIEVGVLVADIAGANETNAVYGKNTYMEYNSGKVYNSIISEAYDSSRAGDSTVVGSDIYMATGPAGIPIPIPATGMSKGHQDTGATGYINVTGALVKFSTEVRADDNLTIAGAGRVIATDGPGSVDIKGDILLSGSSTLSAQDISSDKKIEVSSKSTLAVETLQSAGGVVLKEGSSLVGLNNNITGSSDLNVEADLTSDNSNILSNFGSIDLKNLTGDNNKVIARNDIEIIEGLVGNSNALTADKTIGIGQGITGDRNILVTSSSDGKIQLGSNANGNSIEGNQNSLSSVTIKLDGKISGNSNILNAIGSIATGGIEGNHNSLTVTGNTNSNANSPLITVNGSILGDGNKLEIDYNGSIVVKGDISNAITGGTDGNELTVNGNGNINVSGTVSGNNNLLQTLGGGNIVLGSLGDNNGLAIEANGKLTVTNASHATIDLNSIISVAGDIVLGSGLVVPDTDSTLLIKGGSTMTSVSGNILANQNLVVSGLGSKISADKGTITVNATLQADKNAQITASSIKSGNLFVMSGATVSATGSGKEIILNRGKLLVEDATVNGNISGVLNGSITGKDANSAIDGTITGVGADSGLQINGLVTVGSKTIDGSISNFEDILLGGDGSIHTDITINGDVITSEDGKIVVNHGNKVVITDEMTAGSSIDIFDSNLTVGGAKDEIKYGDTGYLGTHPLVGVIDHSDMEAGTTITVSNSTVNVFDNMTAGTDIVIGNGSNVTVGNADQIKNQYAFNYDVVSSEVPAIVATIIAGSNVTGYIMPNVPIELKSTLTHSDMTSGGNISISGESTVKVYDNMTSTGGNITVSESQVSVGTIGDLTYTGKDDSSITVFEKHGNMTAQGNIALEKSTVNVIQDMLTTTGGIQITDCNPDVAFSKSSVDDASITVGRDQIAGSFITIQDSSVSVGRDQIAGTEIGIQGSDVVIGRDQTAQLGNIVISDSYVEVGSEEQAGNQTAQGGIGILEDSLVIIHGNQTAQTTAIEVMDSELKVTGNQLAQTNIMISSSDATILGSQTAKTGQIMIDDSSNVSVGTVDVNADQTAYTNIVINDQSHVTVHGNQTAQTGKIQVLKNSTLEVSGTQTAHTDIDIDGFSTVMVAGNQTAETGHIQITDKSEVTVGSEESGADQSAYSNISIDDSLVNIFGNQTALTDYIQVTNNSDLLVTGNQSASTHILMKDSTATIGGNQTAGTSISIDTSSVSVGGNQTAQNGSIGIKDSTVTVGDSMLAQSNDGTTEANIVITGSKVNVGSSDLIGEDHNDMIADNSISISTSTVSVLDDVMAKNGNIVFTNNTEKLDGSDFAIVIGDSLIANGNAESGKGSIEVSNTTLDVGSLQPGKGHGNMMADNHIHIDKKSDVLVHGDQWAGTEINIDDSIVKINGSQTSNTGFIQILNGSDVTVGLPGASGDMFAYLNILMKDSTVLVNGNQTSVTDSIVANNSKVTVTGDQTAHTNIGIVNDSTVNVNGDQTAQTGEIVIEDSELTVGTADAVGNQTAYGNISQKGSDVTIHGNQTSQTGSIFVFDDSILTVDGNQTAYKDIAIVDSEATIGGNQMAETGKIGIQNSEVIVDGDQFAKTSISIIKGTDAGAEASVVAIHGNQTADQDYINVKDSMLTVGGNQTAGTFINIEKSTADIDGNQTARKGNVQVTDAMLTVGDNMSALSGDGTTIANIIIDNSKVAVGSDSLIGTDHNNMIADSNISIKKSTTSVLGNMTARDGNIVLTDNTAKVTSSNYSVVVGGSMTAKGDKNYKGDDASFGGINISNTSLQVGAEGAGDMLADNFINIEKNSKVDISGDQQAGSFIQVTGSTLDLTGSQTALEGQIVLTDSSVNIGENQTARTDIGISNSTVTIGGNQTAELGNIIIEKGSVVTIGSGEEEGDLLAGNGIKVADSTLNIFGDQTSLTSGISIENATVGITGNQTSATMIDMKKSSQVNIGGTQKSLNGNIQVANSNLTVDESMLAQSKDGKTEANIILTDSTVKVGSADVAGDMIAANSISITNTKTDVVGNMMAQNGVITLTDINGSKAVNVGDSMIAKATKKDDKHVNGSIIVNNTTLNVGTEIATEGHGNMTADDTILIGKGSHVTVNGDQTAGYVIGIDGDSVVTVKGDMESQTALKDANSLEIKGTSTVTVDGSVKLAEGSNMIVNGGSKLTVGEQLVADKGSLLITGANTEVSINTDNDALYDSVISSGISSIQIDAQTKPNTGNVVLDSASTLIKGSLTATAWQNKDGITIVDGKGSNEGSLKVTAGDLSLRGLNQITDDAKLWATNGNISLAGNNVITDSVVLAEQGKISIVSDETSSKATKPVVTLIKNATITAGSTVTIAGTKDQMALVTGKTEIVSNGSEAYKLASGEGIQMGVLLDNVSLDTLTGEKDVTAKAGSIVINNRVDLTGTTLYTNSASSARIALVKGGIMVNGGSVLYMHRDTVLEGTLSSADTSAWLVKNGGDTLRLDYSAKNYNGKIDVRANDGSEIVINCEGLGHDSVTLLKDTNLTITSAAFSAASDNIVSIGSIDTSYDSGARYPKDGKLNEMFTSGSYTMDRGTRVGFKEIGTFISFNQGHAGDVVSAHNLTMNGNTLVRLEGALHEDGSMSFDRINMDGTLDAGGARIFATLLSGKENVSSIQEQERVQLIGISGDNTLVKSAFNEDRLYDVALNSETGTYQRNLRTFNSWVETRTDGVYLAYSRHFTNTSMLKNHNQQQVADVLSFFNDRANHTEGTLAASDSTMDHLIDAFDYTRSEGDVLRALDSVSGRNNTLAQHAMMDGNRHHLETLRSSMGMPSCEEASSADSRLQVSKDSTVWMSYTGGYDFINGDYNMDDYTRSFQGGLLGYERTLDCNFLVGIDFGFENAISRTMETKFDANTYFIDLYLGAKTGIVNHKFSVGVGIYDFDTERDVNVAAASHTFMKKATGSMTGTAINVVYEISSDFQIYRRSKVTPFLAANFSANQLNDLREKNIGDAGLMTSFDDVSQFDLALGARFVQEFSLIANQEPATFVASLAARGEFSDHQPEVENRFIADPDLKFRSRSLKRAPFFIQVGSGLSVPFANQWTAQIGGSGEFGNDRASVNGNIGVRYSF